ncbi:MAG: dihydrofolate reductase [Candidatus Colwellbacteria bacterium]|nr:dihydrofolate reductase [Candidatus Colwellbacteria bacterium]
MDAGVGKKIIIVAAIAENGVIGRNGDMPWNLRTDLARFFRMTKGGTVIMGGKTFKSIYIRNGRALPKRKNIVITRHPEDQEFQFGVTTVGSPEEAIAISENDEVFIGGGAEIYASFIGIADELRLTEVDISPNGDAFFPDWNRADWDMVSEELVPAGPEDSATSNYRIYRRKKFVFIGNARVDEQREAMQRIIERKECPFCMENLRKEHSKPFLMETEHWILTENQWPYKTAKKHFLGILKTHIENISDMPEGAGEEIFQIMRRITSVYGVEGGALAMRFGGMSMTGATVSHLHFHVIEPHSTEDDGYEPVRFRIGGKKKETPL